MLSAELARGESWLMWGQRQHCQEASGQIRPLLAKDRRGVAFRPGACAPGDCEPEEALLCLRRDADHLGRAVRPELFGRLQANGLEALLRGLVAITARYAPGINAELLTEELLERERLFPNLVGEGVLVPHAYLPGMNTRLVTAAVLPEGLTLADGEVVRLAFLVLGPRSDPEGHLATLADLARLVLQRELREALMSAPDGETYVRLVRQQQG